MTTPNDFSPDVPGRFDDVTRLLDHYRHSKQPLVSMGSRHWHPLIDVFEAGDSFFIIADLAGMHENEVEVITGGNRLIIRGQRPPYGADKRNRAYHQMEIPAGPFERVIELPPSADTNGAHASYDNGFLEIVVPQRTRDEQRSVRIQTRS